ncbi:S8 family serine peptidase [candidate division KSB1 bacterium]|nr:S8 family serine peptidase [candidate division KSB1 bacterium]
MRFNQRNIYILIITSFILLTSQQQLLANNENPWQFLSTEVIGARQFIQQHPAWDGSGTIIFILDSGVDMGVSGLQKTSNGEVKIIDVVDFSGQGDVTLEVGTAKNNDLENFIEHPEGFRLYDYHKLKYKPANNEYLIGFLEESRFKNSKVDDINNNFIVDEEFGILVFEIENAGDYEYIAYIDTDADGHVDDENPIYDYGEKQEYFQFRGRDPLKQKNLLNFALKMDVDNMRVSFHFDDGGHGTHVAGISAGYQLFDQPGYNGIAPGAQIISLKIGNNTLAGNATVTGSIREAFMYGARWSQQHPGIPVIFNLSYGMGVEVSGESQIERFIQALATEYDHLMIFLSGGNIGPGISSIGKPAGSNRTFSTGAMLDRKSARDLYGLNLSSDRIFYFSSRGGEVPKPDAIAPGVAASTVPPFENDEKKFGTSMASPQAAGAAAILLSGIKQQHPEMVVKNSWIYRALKFGAIPLKEYSFLDQGNGIINIHNSFQILKSHLDKNRKVSVLDYEIQTESPVFSRNAGVTAYWRSGGYFPNIDEPQTFLIKPIFAKGTTADQINRFFAGFDLEMTAPWLKINQKSIYIKGDEGTTLKVFYQPAYLQEPGLYTGKIIGYQKNKPRRPEHIEFELLNTVIIPYQFHTLNNYQNNFRDQQVEPGNYIRYFLQIPPEATAMELEFLPHQSQYCSVYPIIFDPAGRRFALLEKCSSCEKNSVSKLITDDDLLPGIWEIIVYSPFIEQKVSKFSFNVQFRGLKFTPSHLSTFTYSIGQNPTGIFNVINNFNQPVDCFAEGIIAGYSRVFKKTLFDDVDNYSYKFRINNKLEKIVFKFELPTESFQKFTNIAINIKDQEGNYLVQDGMTYSNRTISFENPSTGLYTLEILGARTYRHDDESWSILLTEYYYQPPSERIRLEFKQNSKSNFVLYPQIKTILNYTLNEAPKITPEGFHAFGLVMFKDKESKQIVATLPIKLKTDAE